MSDRALTVRRRRADGVDDTGGAHGRGLFSPYFLPGFLELTSFARST
jgi:hypothetical protein